MLTALLIVMTLPAQEPVQKADKPAKEKPVCRSVRKTGSRLPERVCKTQAEWDAEAQKNAEQPLITPHGPQ